MILRHATLADSPFLEEFDLGGDGSPWLDEVREIVGGLVAWRNDTAHAAKVLLSGTGWHALDVLGSTHNP